MSAIPLITTPAGALPTSGAGSTEGAGPAAVVSASATSSGSKALVAFKERVPPSRPSPSASQEPADTSIPFLKLFFSEDYSGGVIGTIASIIASYFPLSYSHTRDEFRIFTSRVNFDDCWTNWCNGPIIESRRRLAIQLQIEATSTITPEQIFMAQHLLCLFNNDFKFLSDWCKNPREFDCSQTVEQIHFDPLSDYTLCQMISNLPTSPAAADKASVPSSPGLTRVNFTHCHKLSDDSVEVLVERFPLLEHVDFSYCCDLTDESIYLLVDNCPNLRTLNLTRNIYSQFSREAIDELREALPDLIIISP